VLRILSCVRALSIAISVASAAAQPVVAQGVSDGADGVIDTKKISNAAAKLKKGSTSVPSRGITIMPGVIMSTSAFTDGGYDSNPNQSFDEEGSPYLRSGVNVGLMAIGERTIANVAATASWLHFGEEIIRQDRLDANVEASVVYLLMPGLTVAAGGLYDRDGVFDGTYISENQTAGGFLELGYENKTITSFLRGRFMDLRYLSDQLPPLGIAPPLIPLVQSSAFDVQRSEISSGILIGNRYWLGIYGEANAGLVDYIKQPLESVVDRDGGDYYAKAGIRVTFSRSLLGDFGWRWNRRDLEDQRISEFNSNFFDGSLTWRPSPFFWLTTTIERIIGEPSRDLSLLADSRSFELNMGYLPVAGVQITFGGMRQLVNEIGADFTYRSTLVGAEVSYDYSSRVQLYSGLRYEYVEADQQDLDYDRLRVGAGVRVLLDGRNLLEGGAPNPFAGASRLRLPSGAELNASIGYSWFNLPSIAMTTVVGGPFFDQALRRIEDHGGELRGVRTDLRLAHIAEHAFSQGHWLSFGVGGFYARYDETGHSSCQYTSNTDCAFLNIVDFDHSEENNTGPFGKLKTNTQRDLHYWGAFVDARIGRWLAGGLKDGTPFRYLSPFKVGLAVRGLNQHTKLHSIDTEVPDPVDYKERIDTQYYGGFLGIEHKFPMGRHGWSFTVDGNAGVYQAYSDYEGRYLAYVPIGGDKYILERGGVDDGDEEVSFIGGVKIGLRRDSGAASFGIFGQAEYLSYVPKVVYNSNDNAGGSPFGIVGKQRATRLVSDDAFTYTAGLSLTIPIQ